MRELFEFTAARLPLLVSVPHAGTLLPDGLESRLSAVVRDLPDTDWFVNRLYGWVTEIGAGLIVGNHSRYLIDLNRPPDDAALYKSTTPGLIPLRTFSGIPLYVGETPDADEVQQRLFDYWQPYHRKIREELDRMKSRYGFAILFDAHSIRSQVPQLFEGTLADFNLGSYDGQSAASSLVSAATGVLRKQKQYSHIVDGRFKGGYITRHYGRPDKNVHALQLEMSQSVYMREDPPLYDLDAAGRTQEILKELLMQIINWRPAGG